MELFISFHGRLRFSPPFLYFSLSKGSPMAETGTHFDLKIFLDKKKGRVLFAEADGEFVDVLFSFLTLPLGTILRLVGKTQSEPTSTLGCFTTLSQSVHNLGNQYFYAEGFKDMLLHPRSSSEAICRKLKINMDDTKAEYFLCPYCLDDYSCCSYMSIYKNTMCPCCCWGSMTVHKVIPLEDSSKVEVFVKRAKKFIISDDIQVIPVVPGTFIGILNDLGFDDMNAIEGTTVKLGINELIELVKRTFLSTTPLTDLFVSKSTQHVNILPNILSLPKRDGVDRSGEDRKINVKVVLRKSNKELLFVEAGHDFIDFLFSFLVIPLGEALHLMEGKSGLGCIDGLYKSVLSLDSQCFVSPCFKNILLRPKLPPLVNRSNLLFPLETTNLSCSIDGVFREMPIDSKVFGVFLREGFVRGDETFMVLDDLALMPFSFESLISMCNRNKLSVSDLEERSLSLGIEEGISILRASLNSTCALSNGLLHNDLILKEPRKEK